MRRSVGVAAAIVLAIFAVTVVSGGVTRAYGSDSSLDTTIGGWPDGADPATFWDSPLVDIPGLSLVSVHCHARMTFELQIGATAPPHSNPCYAAKGMYEGQSEELDLVAMLGGGKALYRRSEDYGPWQYFVADVMTEAP